MPINKADFDYMCDLARSNSAIVIGKEKEYLVESRLEPLVRKTGFNSIEELVAEMRGNAAFGELHAQAIDALTTNETYFFRDFHPFEALKQSIIPELIQRNAASRTLSIWSAACSSGQEAYSIAILIKENFPQLKDWKISIIGTDLSSRVLKQAQDGSYNQLEANRGLPAPLLMKYFSRVDNRWIIHPDLRNMVSFRKMNLIEPWPYLPPFDLIFIRNVLIYFDMETKKSILAKMRTRLRPQGHLFLGAVETTLNLDDAWRSTKNGNTTTFQLKESPEFGNNLSGGRN